MVKLHRIRTGEGGRGGGAGPAGGGRGGGRASRGRGRGRWGDRGAGAASALAAAAAAQAAAAAESDGTEAPSGSEGAVPPPPLAEAAAAADVEARATPEPASEVVLGAAVAAAAVEPCADGEAATPRRSGAAPDLPVPVAAVITPAKVSKHVDHALLSKRYAPLFMWGQLSGWFKQTVYDVTASLSAERRGTLSLPDMDSCYPSGAAAGSKPRYTPQVRCACVWCAGGSAPRTVRGMSAYP